MRMFKWPNDIDPPVYFANQQWAVTAYGLECLTENYSIERSRLTERHPEDRRLSDWVMQLSGKQWCDIYQFGEALKQALQIHRVKGRTLIDVDLSVAKATREMDQDRDFERFAKWMGLGDRMNANDLLSLGDLYRSAIVTGEWAR